MLGHSAAYHFKHLPPSTFLATIDNQRRKLSLIDAVGVYAQIVAHRVPHNPNAAVEALVCTAQGLDVLLLVPLTHQFEQAVRVDLLASIENRSDLSKPRKGFDSRRRVASRLAASKRAKGHVQISH